MSETRPILYTFRRCPYAMRARLALFMSEQNCEIREVVLRDKPDHMLEISMKGEVPVLLFQDGEVLDESIEIMQWALEISDPDGWLNPSEGGRADMLELVELCDGDFKHHLDRYKYPERYPDTDPMEHRAEAEKFIKFLDDRLAITAGLMGSRACLADFAIAPFIRQFANTDREWFDATPYPNLQNWLETFLASELFECIMDKYPQWHEGDKPVMFLS
jgi:glutathione S-transferase